MPSLADLQGGFAAALRDAGLPPPATIAGQARQPQSRRFDVYRNNRMASLIEALESAFPALRQLVGDAFFKAAAKAYIDLDPPQSPVLLLYGQGFGKFLDGFPPASQVPYLGDVARLEWARLNAFHAADAASLAIDRLAALPPADLAGLRFELHPSLQLLHSRWPVVSLWASSSGTDPDAAVEMSQGQDAMVIRPALNADTRILPAGGYDFIGRLLAGAPLAEAAELAALRDPAFDLAVHLQGLFEVGAVTAVLPAGPEPKQE
ncbi:DUF2063 domain-containing protein [Pelagibius litoralis]|uniref:DUF2063 domain-containing protein n=1 Tax=Pelagibius litoralis TaxID=374515 RepID=A0A967C206_9PROT|nr:DNA-binding domain-containing protein [Pelagibius litoralis]NIA68416.1 DUF2063 domain-containing protein [Pelagibius litoralis]